MERQVGVIGAGIMGAGIAEVVARSGREVVLVDVSLAAAETARDTVDASLAKAVARQKLTGSEAQEALDRIATSDRLQDLERADIVVEAVTEDETIKTSLFAELGHVLPPSTIIATNTSSIPVVKLGAVSGRADRVVGVHFFNPVPVLPLVELVPSLTTSAETLRAVRRFVTDELGKETIESADRAGFVVNSLLVPYLLSAVRMYEAGYAAAADIDRGMQLGCAHPMGPLALADLIGLDTVRAIGVSMYEEFKEPLYSPPPLLERMVDAGLLGQKSGRGFYQYAE
jgi:3-hydroxybutyryl-CoA dehydrogenase